MGNGSYGRLEHSGVGFISYLHKGTEVAEGGFMKDFDALISSTVQAGRDLGELHICKLEDREDLLPKHIRVLADSLRHMTFDAIAVCGDKDKSYTRHLANATIKLMTTISQLTYDAWLESKPLHGAKWQEGGEKHGQGYKA